MDQQVRDRHYSLKGLEIIAAIEEITKVMAHEDVKIRDILKDFQDNKISPRLFYIKAMNYYDILTIGGFYE